MSALAIQTDRFQTPAAWRLHLLRAGYLLLVVGLGATIWPELLHHPQPWSPMRSVVVSMLAAMSALSVLGLRYPLQMLPLIFFEVTWKSIWLLSVAVPALATHRMDAKTGELMGECLIAVVFLIVMPWDYVAETFVRTIVRGRGQPVPSLSEALMAQMTSTKVAARRDLADLGQSRI
jgi:hypothetical protein